jgi:hypothetical protein
LFLEGGDSFADGSEHIAEFLELGFVADGASVTGNDHCLICRYRQVSSERERADIETRAAAVGLSVSAYLRNLGLEFQPHSTLDHEAILALIKVNADQGRLGGLFKLWLSGQSAPAAEASEILRLLAAIEECQLKLKALIGQLSDGN